jgi:hypothetical protein
MSTPDFKNPERLRTELVLLLEGFEADLKKEDLRFKVLKLAHAFNTLRQLGVSIMPVSSNFSNAARSRIILYFQRYVGQIIHGDELLVVSGIQDYPRRIRELRVEFGWPIISGTAIKQMVTEGEFSASIGVQKIDSDCYMLLRDSLDKNAAYRWNFANSIRKDKSIGGKQKILLYLKENVGVPVTGEELKYVANDSSEWARRIRELRTEEGWKIKTKQTGRPDLPQGVYILEDDKQSEKHDRSIPDPVQIAVLERDNFQCIRCGWSRNKMHADDPRSQLELHHIRPHVMKGENTKENLATLCNVCHDEIHRADKNNTWSVAEFNLWAKSNL